MSKLSVLLIDDHRLFLEGMRYLIREFNAEAVIESAESVSKALNLFDQNKHFDWILLDLNMPGLNGFECIDAIKARPMHYSKLVVISGTQSSDDIQALAERNINGFIPKAASSNEMLQLLHKIQNAEQFVLPEYLYNSNTVLRQHIENTTDQVQMNDRQKQVLQLIAAGKSNKEIAQLLAIKETTVKYHISNLFSMLNVNRRTACIAEAQKIGLL